MAPVLAQREGVSVSEIVRRAMISAMMPAAGTRKSPSDSGDNNSDLSIQRRTELALSQVVLMPFLTSLDKTIFDALQSPDPASLGVTTQRSAADRAPGEQLIAVRSGPHVTPRYSGDTVLHAITIDETSIVLDSGTHAGTNYKSVSVSFPNSSTGQEGEHFTRVAQRLLDAHLDDR